MNIGIIGSTGHVQLALDSIEFSSSLDVVGVAPGSANETVDSLYEEVKRFTQTVTQYNDYERLLDEENPDIVVVAPYFGDIARAVMSALDRDMHVFTEKPVATTQEELRSVQKSYSQSAGKLAAMFGTRYTPWFRTAHELVNDDAVGDIRLLNGRKSYKLGNRKAPFLSRETYGGTIPWVGTHAIDWINWMTDSYFESVTALHSRQCNRGHEDLEATALSQFRMTDDVFASVTMDYLRPAQAPTHGDDQLRIVGTEGVLEVRDQRVFLIDSEVDGQREVPLVDEADIFEDFLAGIREGSNSSLSAKSAFQATDAALRARRAADENARVSFDNR